MKPPTWLTLDRLANWLTFGVVVIAFALSFGALKDLAADVGIIYPALYPVMIDAGLVIYNIMALQSSLKGERNRYAWFLIILATTVSVFLNVVHSLDEPPPWLTAILGSAMAAIPPLVIFGAFHLVVLRIEQNARHRRLDSTVAELETAIVGRTTELRHLDEIIGARTSEQTQLSETVRKCQAVLDDLNGAIQNRTAEQDALTVQIEQLTSELNTLKRNQRTVTRTTVQTARHAPGQNGNKSMPVTGELPDKQMAMEKLLAFVATRPEATLADIGQAIGRSKSTVSVYVSELMQAHQLGKNERGWQVVVFERQVEADSESSETSPRNGAVATAEPEPAAEANA
ncbi:MAG: DUF2637 domain-containing protein [Anaerolineae bacterium]|nr:DUF2637 domain-containing protein [Anaerolineae bacterium]